MNANAYLKGRIEIQHGINKIFKLKATGVFKNTAVVTEVSMLLLLPWMFILINSFIMEFFGSHLVCIIIDFSFKQYTIFIHTLLWICQINTY